MAGVDQKRPACLIAMRFFGFSKYLHEHSSAVKKISLRVIFLPIFPILNNYTANRLRRSGKAMSPPAAGVATRRFAHFLHFQSGQCQSRTIFSTPKKIQGRSFFAFYSSLISQNIYTGLRHKAAQNSLFPLNFFPKGCFPFKYATDTDRLRKRVR